MQLSGFQSLKAMFRKLDPLEVKRDELLDAKLALLSYQTTLEYHQAMVSYTEGKIRRLTLDIQQDEDERHKMDVAKRAIESGKAHPAIQLARQSA